MCTQSAGVAPTTNQQMEIMGALEGLKSILEGRHKELQGLQYNTIEVISDSAYLINCMTQLWWMEWMYNGWVGASTREPVKNKELWEEMIQVKTAIEATGKKLIWTKIKGHCGIMYNEVADKLAVKGKLSVS
jgi:ribonuclease HI